MGADSHKCLIVNDEAFFFLAESINKQNYRFWFLTERPEDWIEKPLLDAKVLVWCAISCRKIYSPYFLQDVFDIVFMFTHILQLITIEIKSKKKGKAQSLLTSSLNDLIWYYWHQILFKCCRFLSFYSFNIALIIINLW